MICRDQIQLCVFDLILCNNDLLYNCTLQQRKKVLHSTFPSRPEIGVRILDEINFSPDTNIVLLIQQSVKAGCEGLVLKKLNSNYPFGSRNRGYLQYKCEYQKNG